VCFKVRGCDTIINVTANNDVCDKEMYDFSATIVNGLAASLLVQKGREAEGHVVVKGNW
jgi:hypothetical protein